MESLDTPQGRLDVVARLIARDAVIGRLPSAEIVDRYWDLRDQVARTAPATLAAVV